MPRHIPARAVDGPLLLGGVPGRGMAGAPRARVTALWLPDTESLARLALLAVTLYVLVALGLELLPFALAVGVILAPLLGAVLGFRWLAGLLGTPGAVLALAAAGLALGLAACAYGRRRGRP